MTLGHVFLVRGDLRAINCDAIGYSGNRHNEPSSRWADDVGNAALPGESRIDDRRVVRRYARPEGEPAAYVVPVPGTASTEIAWYVAALRVFLRRATDDMYEERKPSANAITSDKRAIPMLAVPLFGGSKGGQAKAQGELLHGILDELWAFTNENPVDVCLVLDEDSRFEAAQWYRRQHAAKAWNCLSSEHVEDADKLAEIASAGDMALFLGAGVSVGAGLPRWTKLLEEVAKGSFTDQELGELNKLSTLDCAQLLAKRMGEDVLRAKVSAVISAKKRSSLAHALLAALPVREIATTNYDDLFEQAAKKANREVHVLPYDGTLSRDARWLLKLHGTISTPEDIVLSRQTFLQYEASRAALAGLLAGVLMTRHVVFVGSSFSDDNVLRITEEVQRLSKLPSPSEKKEPRLGTCLAVALPSIQKQLWEGEFAWVDLGSDAPTAGRMLEIFLDRVLGGTTTSATYLFDRRFAGGLSEDEKQLRDQLSDLLSRSDAIQHPAVTTLLKQLSTRLGWPPKA